MCILLDYKKKSPTTKTKIQLNRSDKFKQVLRVKCKLTCLQVSSGRLEFDMNMLSQKTCYFNAMFMSCSQANGHVSCLLWVLLRG